MNQDVLSLKVTEGYTRDNRKAIVRIDHYSMNKIKASKGDIVEIKGNKRTVARCFLIDPSTEGKKLITADPLIRYNAGIKTGDTITIRKIKAITAEKIVLVPREPPPPFDEKYVQDTIFKNIPLVEGDDVLVLYLGGMIEFHVMKITPKADAVIVTDTTLFHIAKKAV